MWERELAVAVGAARAAGAIIREAFAKPHVVREKSRGNPVTETDLLANHCIERQIRAAFPHDGWLSEETRDSRARLPARRVWIVDPLDGTNEFIRHVAELGVCIALAEDGEAVLGVFFNPLRDELYTAVRGGGTRCNGEPVQVSDTADLATARVLASRSESKRGEWKRVEGRARIVPVGSVAYKLALVAAGRGDATFTLKPKNEWDVCAGTALIEEAGGRIGDRHGRPLRFNQPDTTRPGIIATNAALFGPVCELVAELSRG